MNSRDQYLEVLREEYRGASKKQKTRLLNEARKRTRLNRKVLIRKLAHPMPVKTAKKRRRRGKVYGAEVKAPLAEIWELFDYPCGQRLVAILGAQVDRLRALGELRCSDTVAELLKRMSAKTADRLLAHERQVRQLKRQRRAPVHRLLYQLVRVKLPNEWDREQVGNLQTDFVAHGGGSAAGEYGHTFSATDIASGWWEGEPQMGRSQQASEKSCDAVRRRVPFRVVGLHLDNDTALLNDLLWNYCRRRRIELTRSRPYEKNDNCWVEQKNWTHVRKVVGYRRYDRPEELELMQRLYRVLADSQNFFQPVMKLKEKVREGGKIRRVYDRPKTPYQRLLESGALNRRQRAELIARYRALNPAQLRREIELLRNQLFDLVESKDQQSPPRARRHGPGIVVNQARKRRMSEAAD